MARRRLIEIPQLKSTHKGNFKAEFGIDVECYVLNDEAKTAVISKRGIIVALGLTAGGGRLTSIFEGKSISKSIDPELREKIQNPLIFSIPTDPNLSVIGHGYDVTILIDICKAIVKADQDGNIMPNQKKLLKQAQVILGASAKAGIKGLVYALSGYNATRDEIINSYKIYVRQEAREYEKEFPDQLYEEWYRLYNLTKPERSKPWKFKYLTIDQVYKVLAKSNGKIYESIVDKRELSGYKRDKLHQFLADVGVKSLRSHLGQLLGIAKISKTQEEYEGHLKTLFGMPPPKTKKKEK